MRPASYADAGMGGGAQLVLSSQQVPGVPEASARGSSGFPAARLSAQRDHVRDRRRPGGHLGQPLTPQLGRPLPGSAFQWRSTDDVRLVRGAAELSYGDGLSGERIQGPMAGAAA